MSWRTCPKCKSRATKIFHLNTGKYECQICRYQYEAGKMERVMKQTEHAADRLIEWLQDFKALAVKLGKMPCGTIYVGMFLDGTGTITVNQQTFGSSFRPISEAMDEALDWVMRDDAAEQNATLGLEANGVWLTYSQPYFDRLNMQEIER